MLQKIQFKPGFNKQATATGAEGQWVDGDNVRFRYGQPEKIGGWEQLVDSTLAGPVRAQHTWTDLQGRKYAALGTAKVLVIYYEGGFYDITPINADQTGCTFDSTTTDDEVTVNLTSHGLSAGDYFKFKTVTLPGGGVTGYTLQQILQQMYLKSLQRQLEILLQLLCHQMKVAQVCQLKVQQL